MVSGVPFTASKTSPLRMFFVDALELGIIYRTKPNKSEEPVDLRLRPNYTPLLLVVP